MLIRRTAICVCACAIMAQSLPAAAVVQPFTNVGEMGALSEEEQRVWSSGREFDEALRKNGSLYQDEALERYVQSVADRVFPEFVGRIHVHVIRSPQLNAFALPNGSIYINTGMLARMDNEAQLATLLGHEGIHFINRHGFQEHQSVKSASAFALGVAMLGIPIFGDLLAMSSISGFSQEKENEADREGFGRMVKAGYAPRESVRVFEHLSAEVKALEIKEPFFFSSHPKLQQRVENYNELIGKENAVGEDLRASFLEHTGKVRMDNLANEISMDRYKSVILMLEDEKRRAEYPPEAQFYLGEAYRRRGKDGDEKLAEQFYDRTIAQAPQFAPSYRALGMICLKHKEYRRAAENFDLYLTLAPDAKDAAYVRQYSELAKQKGAKQ